MNKYEEALDWLKLSCDCIDDCKAVETLQELVDKATPKKPIPLFIPMVFLPYRCPVCKTLVNRKKEKFDYCPKCGQKLDWSEEE